MLPDSIWTSRDYFSWLTNATLWGPANFVGSTLWFLVAKLFLGLTVQGKKAATIPSLVQKLRGLLVFFVVKKKWVGNRLKNRNPSKEGCFLLWSPLTSKTPPIGSNDIYLGESYDVSPSKFPIKTGQVEGGFPWFPQQRSTSMLRRWYLRFTSWQNLGSQDWSFPRITHPPNTPPPKKKRMHNPPQKKKKSAKIKQLFFVFW